MPVAVDYAREYLPFLPGWTLPAMYGLFGVVVVVAIVGLRRRLLSYRSGGVGLFAGVRAAAGPLGPRVTRMLNDALLQRKVRERRLPLVLHFGIFYGVVALTVGTALVFLDEDILLRLTSFRVLSGGFYVVVEALLDLAGLALVVGVLVALWRRLVMRPAFLVLKTGTLLILVGLLYIGVTGFVLEGYRIAAESDPWARAAFAGYVVSQVFEPVTAEASGTVTGYTVMWWSHLAVAFALLGALAYTGLAHILLIPGNTLGQDAQRPRTQLTTPFNLAEVMESEEEVELVAGTATTQALAPGARLSADACVACGRCHAECPANVAGRPLSPRDLVLDLQATLRSGSEPRPATDFEKAVWSCTNCYACEQACPARIRHVDFVLDFRRALVDQNRLDEQKLGMLQALDRSQNPYRLPSHERAAWLADLPYADEVLVGESAEEPRWLYWLGCTACYDSRASRVAMATFDLLRAAGESFVTLGPAEPCCGEPAKRLGEEGRFQMIAMANMELIRESGAPGIVSHCPHCVNVLGREYRSLGLEIEVRHHAELLVELLADGRLTAGARDGRDGAVVFHEPCTLARAGSQAPALHLLEQTAAGPVLLPERSGVRTFCCGGGGANMWYTVEDETQRISSIRLEELLGTGAGRVAVSCPFCLSMLGDAAGSRQGGVPVEIVDVAEVAHAGCFPADEASG